LLARLRAATGGDGPRTDTVYYARRCVYRRRQGLLLVTEVFLPAVLNLAAPDSNMK
jgi:chorismate--pyruvate lyase